MKVGVSWPTTGELRFLFETDLTDAVVPLPAVWFRHDRMEQMGTLRVALMAYLLARPFIGNSFVLSGHPLPAHLASRLHQDLEADEFFVGPVTNIPEQIVPDFVYDVLEGCAEHESEMQPAGEKTLTCRRNELGYSVAASDAEAPLLSIATNVDLFAAFTEQPRMLSLVLIYLCAYDVLGVKRLRPRCRLDGPWLSRMNLLLAEVGGRAFFELGDSRQ